jgi:hypothetical protein
MNTNKPPLLIGNDKTGKSVRHWSLPAAITCPGATEDCFSACYAKKGHFTSKFPIERFKLNDAMRKQSDFVDRVVGQIASERIDTVRIHVSGDFDSSEYVQQWIDIVTSRKRTKFYAYTRSWAVSDLVGPLSRLAALPNMQLWLSADRSGDVPPVIDGTRVAYMAANDDDIADYHVDIVFRVKRRTKQVRQGGVIVCPTERSSLKGRAKCETCRLCFDNVERLDVLNRLPVLVL